MAISYPAKVVVFLGLNIAIATCGATLLAFGAILQSDERKGVKDFYYLSIGGFSIGIGVLVFLVACWGFWAIFKRKTPIFDSYATLTLTLFIIQLVLAAIALNSVNNSKCELNTEIEDGVEELFSKHDDVSIRLINNIQKKYHCCGANGPEWWSHFRMQIPHTCCLPERDPCPKPFAGGCATLYMIALQTNTAIIGGVAVGFAPIELLAAILAWYLRLDIKKQELQF